MTTTSYSYKVETRTASYELSSQATGAITGPTVQKGETVVDVTLGYDVLGASTTLSVGDGNSAARFISATDTSSAGVTRTDSVGGINYTYTADDTIDVTLAGATATGTVELVVTVIQTY